MAGDIPRIHAMTSFARDKEGLDVSSVGLAFTS